MYKVTSNEDVELGNFKSVKAAVDAVEQHYQCGISETVKEVRNSLKLIGTCTVSHCLAPGYNCTIHTV